MNDAEGRAVFRRRSMSRVKTMKRASRDARCDADRRMRAALPAAPNQRADGLPRDILHDDEKLAGFVDDVECSDHVGMLDARSEARFVEEHLDELRILGVRCEEPFDRDDTRESSGSELLREHDRRHATRPDLLEKCIAPHDERGGSTPALTRLPLEQPDPRSSSTAATGSTRSSATAAANRGSAPVVRFPAAMSRFDRIPEHTLTSVRLDVVELPGLRAVVTPPKGKPSSAVLGVAPLVVGTDAECDLVVDDGRVSRKHCQLTWSQRGVVLRDLGK